MRLQRIVFTGLLLACVVLAARVSERFPLQLDLTAAARHSLSESGARALDAIGKGLEITAFEPDRPVQRAQLDQVLAPYLAHPSAPVLTFIDPERQPALAQAHAVRHTGELHLRLGPRLEVIHPVDAPAIDRALNRLALKGERWIVGLEGHGELPPDDSPEGIGRFAAHLETLGYRLVTLDPRRVEQLPDNTAVLLVAAPRLPYPAHVTELLGRYLDNGGRIAWLHGGAAAPVPAPFVDRLGMRVLPGIVVDAAAARYGLDSPANAIVSEWPAPLLRQPDGGHAVLAGSVALELAPPVDWQLVARLQSSAQSWNETDPLSGRLRRDPERRERQGPLTVAAALQRSDPADPARVIVIGSPALLANGQIGVAANLDLALGLVRWLTDNTMLAGDDNAADVEIRWSPTLAATLAIALMAGLPLLYLGAGLWLRRRRRVA